MFNVRQKKFAGFLSALELLPLCCFDLVFTVGAQPTGGVSGFGHES